MPTAPDPEGLMDRLMRASLDDANALSPTSACVDAEALAAWADGAADAAEAQRIEAHMSSCARCQAMAAAFARADDGDAPARRPGSEVIADHPVQLGQMTSDRQAAPAERDRPAARHHQHARRRWMWLAPLAAATILTTWVVLSRSNGSTDAPAIAARSEPGETSMSRTEPAQTAEAPPPPPMPSFAQNSASAAAADREQRLAKEGTAPAAAPAPAIAAAPAPAGPQASLPKSAPVAGGALAQAPAPPAAESVPLPDAAAPRSAGAARPVSVPPPSPISSGERSFSVAREEVDSSSPNLKVSGSTAIPYVEVIAGANSPAALSDNRIGGNAAPADAAVSRSLGGAGRGGRAGQPLVRWRLFTNGRIERSVDNGTTWTAASGTTTTPLSAGSAPSSTVCWAVGANGLVMVTTDGMTFRRVGAPVSANLRAIRATDATHAAVTAVDGRVFETSDGGASWRESR